MTTLTLLLLLRILTLGAESHRWCFKTPCVSLIPDEDLDGPASHLPDNLDLSITAVSVVATSTSLVLQD